MSTFWVKKMDQAALLADAFKLGILEQFADEPRTVKQVAERLDMKQTRLYRHVDALFQAGLLKLVKEQPKRGTIERYFQTVATRFEIDSSLFATGNTKLNEAVDIVRGIMRDTEQEVMSVFDNAGADHLLSREDTAPIVMRISVQGTASQMASLQKKLNDWIQECEQTNAENSDEEKRSFRGLVMFYPMVKADEA